jgi:hypothetical protein
MIKFSKIENVFIMVTVKDGVGDDSCLCRWNSNYLCYDLKTHIKKCRTLKKLGKTAP